jgi:hemin uptake protein HemP
MNSQGDSQCVRSQPTRSPDVVTAPAAGEQSVSSAQLFKGGKELVIEHASARYRLRITRQGKLILTK